MIDWSYWGNLAVVPYADACILSRGFDPREVKGNVLPPELEAELRRRESIAKSHLGHDLPSHQTDVDRYYGVGKASGVKLAEFRTWAESLPSPFTFPDEFPKAAPVELGARAVAPQGAWPWGDHETKLLRELAAAADKFWKLYDPTDPSTAPTNEAVVAWLKNKGVADRNAQVMATILRADGLPSGPRK